LSIFVFRQELQQYLDEASDGVIYFSMGSHLQSTLMPESKRNAFLGAFSKLKQRVLWKWESDTLPGQPSNVKLGKWLPQSDILGECLVSYFTSLCQSLMQFQLS
jgi:glucuronosyltransferase